VTGERRTVERKKEFCFFGWRKEKRRKVVMPETDCGSQAGQAFSFYLFCISFSLSSAFLFSGQRPGDAFLTSGDVGKRSGRAGFFLVPFLGFLFSGQRPGDAFRDV
jgi:hypothetical protein